MSKAGIRYHALREAQKKKGLTHQQLADCLGIRRSYWRAILDGRVKPDPYLASRIAVVLELPEEDVPCQAVFFRDPLASSAA